MRFHSAIVVATLEMLAEQLGAHRGWFADVAAALQQQAYSAAHEATHELHHALGLVVAMMARLHANVVPIDDLGEPVESLAELVLRARSMVIMARIGHIRELLRDRPGREHAQGWLAGRLENVDDLLTSVHDQVVRNHRIWTPHRQGGVSATEVGDRERVALYHESVRHAQRQLRGLGDSPHLGHFLARGLAATDWPDMSTACREIVAALDLQLDEASPPGRVPRSRSGLAAPQTSSARMAAPAPARKP